MYNSVISGNYGIAFDDGTLYIWCKLSGTLGTAISIVICINLMREWTEFMRSEVLLVVDKFPNKSKFFHYAAKCIISCYQIGMQQPIWEYRVAPPIGQPRPPLFLVFYKMSSGDQGYPVFPYLTTLGTLGFSKNRNATATKNMRNVFYAAKKSCSLSLCLSCKSAAHVSRASTDVVVQSHRPLTTPDRVPLYTLASHDIDDM